MMMGFGFGGIGIIFMVLFWGAVIFGGVWLQAGNGGRVPSDPPVVGVSERLLEDCLPVTIHEIDAGVAAFDGVPDL